MIVATKDTEAAKAALAKFEKTSENTYEPRSHDGIDYKVDDEGVATGVIDDFVVIGTEDAFKRTADTREGDKLADADRYSDAIDDLEENRLGHYYVDAKPLIDAAMKQDPEAAQNFEQFKSILPLDKLGPDHRRVHGRRRRHGARHDRHRSARGAVPQPRRSCGRAARTS